LRSHGGRHRVPGPPEGDEEGVPFAVHLATIVLRERRTQDSMMLGKRLDIATTQPRQEPGRPLDVREEERDGAIRQVRHNAQLRSTCAARQEPTARLAAPLAVRRAAPVASNVLAAPFPTKRHSPPGASTPWITAPLDDDRQRRERRD
jgi:hypothetical protein